MFPIMMLFLTLQMFPVTSVRAQIFEPEGLNMPGAWNGWANPPTNLALASSTQVPGGRIVKFSTGIQRWQTIISVAASGGDLVGGTYGWLFTSGSTSNPWNNKWGSVNVTMNTLQTYSTGGADNNITIADGKWYTMNWEDAGYVNTRAIFMETSAQPADIASVSVPSSVNPGDPVVITATLSQTPCAEELFYLRYSADAWATSAAVAIPVTGTSGSAVIPGQTAGTTVSYYIFSSTIPDINANYDLLTIKLNTNGGSNYSYTVNNPEPSITFANLQFPQSGTIEPGQAYQVYGRAGIPGITGLPTPAPGLEAWVGYNSADTDPATWNATNWITAGYSLPVSGYDEFSANLGAAIATAGTWYYATRFRLNGGSYLYGGYSASGGGFWDGASNVSGVLFVNAPAVPLNLKLNNITIHAEENICYDAHDTITVENFTVNDGGSVLLIAGKSIIFLPGATVDIGGYLKAMITISEEYCPSPGGDAKETEAVAGPVHAAELSCNVFPNPASGEVTLDLTGIPGGIPAWLEVRGIRGEKKYAGSISGNGIHYFSVSGYPAGVYIIRVTCHDQVLSKILVKE